MSKIKLYYHFPLKKLRKAWVKVQSSSEIFGSFILQCGFIAQPIKTCHIFWWKKKEFQFQPPPNAGPVLKTFLHKNNVTKHQTPSWQIISKSPFLHSLASQLIILGFESKWLRYGSYFTMYLIFDIIPFSLIKEVVWADFCQN